MSNTVHVKNISKETTEKDVREFFSFCGKINSLTLHTAPESPDATQSATVVFDKETAAKTALLLDHTQLGPLQVHVTSAASDADTSGSKTTLDQEQTTSDNNHDVAQEDKPRSRIIAEYLAQGYMISDNVIERAIQMDQQHGLSARFTAALKDFDARFHATEQAQAIDSRYGISGRAVDAWRGMYSYFDRVLGTPTGQKLRDFYAAGNKQVVDVHNEARHLADLKAGKDQQSTSTDGKGASQAGGLRPVEGTEKTQCNCAADLGKCLCEPGKCACAHCPKNDQTPTV